MNPGEQPHSASGPVSCGVTSDVLVGAGQTVSLVGVVLLKYDAVVSSLSEKVAVAIKV
jgi:hypothetical protein